MGEMGVSSGSVSHRQGEVIDPDQGIAPLNVCFFHFVTLQLYWLLRRDRMTQPVIQPNKSFFNGPVILYMIFPVDP